MQNLFTDTAQSKAVSGSVVKMLGSLAKFFHWIDRKLQRKLLVILVGLLLTTSVAFLFMVVALYKTQLVNEHARASMQVNRLLQASLENAMLKRDIDGLRGIVKRLGSQAGIAGVAILNPDFEVRFTSGAKQFKGSMATPLARKALASKKPQTRFVTVSDGAQLLRSVNPVHNKPPCKMCHGDAGVHPVNGLLVVDYKAATIKKSALGSALALGGIGAIVIFATGIGFWMALHRLVVRRIEDLQIASRSLAAGKLDTRAPREGHDEIGELAGSFNNMANRLGHSLQALNASEKFLQSVIDSIPDGVRVIDDDYNVVKANRAYCRQSGRSMEQNIAEKCYMSSHHRSEPCPVTLIECPVAELKKTPNKTIKARHQHFNDNGDELFVEVSAARVQLTLNGKPAFYVIESVRDLAEQTRISQEQRLSEIGLLATGVAHEIHNPLSSILLALKAMQGDLDEPDNKRETDIDYLELAETEIRKCLEVTDRLLMLSQPPGDDAKLMDVGEVIGNTLSLLSYQTQDGGVELHIDLEDDLRVVAGESDLGMIAVNLVQNALHAMPDGGRLDICGRRKDGKIELTFADTGLGIAKRNLDRIFLPFWTKRADDSEGRGLGLSICKAILERIGGTIAVSSIPGEGTCFTIMLCDADKERPD